MNNFIYLFIFLISFYSIFCFNFVLFFIVFVFTILLAIYLALDANAKNVTYFNIFKNNQLFDSNNEFNYIELQNFCKSIFTFFNNNNNSLYNANKKFDQKYGANLNNLKHDVYTKIPEIDDEINNFINLVLRDFICGWYFKISYNQEFLNEIRSTFQLIIRIIVARIYTIDKTVFISTKLVEKFISHLKLYRLSKRYLKENSLEVNEKNIRNQFFNFELKSENNKICRDAICEEDGIYLQYLSHISIVLQYLILPQDLHSNKLIKHFLTTILVNNLFFPLFKLCSDSDFINQCLISFCKKRRLFTPLSECFLLTLRSCKNTNELNSVFTILNEEIESQRSKDTGGENDLEIKQQLNSLYFVYYLIKNHLKELEDGFTPTLENDLKIPVNNLANRSKQYLSLSFILQNPVALTFFFEYISSIGKQAYLNFYLNVESFKVHVEQLLIDIKLQKNKENEELNKDLSEEDKVRNKEFSTNLKIYRDAARNIFETYLSEDSSKQNKIEIDKNLLEKLFNKINNEELSETWFDDVHELVYTKMRKNVEFYYSFKNSIHYYKLLKELNLLKNENYDKSNLDILNLDIDLVNKKQSNDNYFTSKTKIENSSLEQIQNNLIILNADILSFGIIKENGNSFGVYCINVIKKDISDLKNIKQENWSVVRRYSDFYAFHQQAFKLLSQSIKFNLPGKKAFNNINNEFLERRKKYLNLYLKNILNLFNLKSDNFSYQNQLKFRYLVLQFLNLDNYHFYKDEKNEPQLLNKTMNNVSNFKTSIKSLIKNSSDNLLDGINKIKFFGNNLSKKTNLFETKFTSFESMKTSKTLYMEDVLENESKSNFNADSKISVSTSCSSLNQKIIFLNDNINSSLKEEYSFSINKKNSYLDSEQNIPLRILILLMDEIFGLKNENFWLRGRIINFLKQVIQTTYGNTINKKIIEFINRLLSPSSIAKYIKSIKNNLWPNGYLAVSLPKRDDSTKLRTKIVAKMFLLSIIPDDLTHILGNESCRKGVISLFEMLQIPSLNRRLIILFFETFLMELFPNNHLDELFTYLHNSKSKKCTEFKNKNFVWSSLNQKTKK